MAKETNQDKNVKLEETLKDIEKIKSSFSEAVFCPKWTQFDRILF